MTKTLNPVEELKLANEIDTHIKYKSINDSDMAPGYPSYPGPTSASVKLENGTVLGSCNRQTWYKMMGYEQEPNSARTMKIFKFGKLIEDMAKDYLKEMGVYKTSGNRFYLPDIKVKGELDFVAVFPGTDAFIIENKSYYGYTTNKLIHGYKTKSKVVPPQPKTEHILQTFIYTYVFREGNEYGFTPVPGGGKILYWSRDEVETVDFSIYPVEIDGDWYPRVNGVVDTRISINNIKARYRELWSYLAAPKDKRVPPPLDFTPVPTDAEIEAKFLNEELAKTTYERFVKDPSDFNRMNCAEWQCVYCSFKKQCLADK